MTIPRDEANIRIGCKKLIHKPYDSLGLNLWSIILYSTVTIIVMGLSSAAIDILGDGLPMSVNVMLPVDSTGGNASFNQTYLDTLYQPLENQRLSTTNTVKFEKVNFGAGGTAYIDESGDNLILQSDTFITMGTAIYVPSGLASQPSVAGTSFGSTGLFWNATGLGIADGGQAIAIFDDTESRLFSLLRTEGYKDSVGTLPLSENIVTTNVRQEIKELKNFTFGLKSLFVNTTNINATIINTTRISSQTVNANNLTGGFILSTGNGTISRAFNVGNNFVAGGNVTGTDIFVNRNLTVIRNLNAGGNTTLSNGNNTLFMPTLKKIDGTTNCANGDTLKVEMPTGRIYCG